MKKPVKKPVIFDQTSKKSLSFDLNLTSDTQFLLSNLKSFQQKEFYDRHPGRQRAVRDRQKITQLVDSQLGQKKFAGKSHCKGKNTEGKNPDKKTLRRSISKQKNLAYGAKFCHIAVVVLNLSMNVFCYRPYLFRNNKIEISRSRKSRSENMPPQQSYFF